jgi:glutamine synthetase
MHLHLSLAGPDGANLFADAPDGSLSPMMLQAIGGRRPTTGDAVLARAPLQNSRRRFASTLCSSASDLWAIENRDVAIRVPAGPGRARHFEHRVARVDANPHVVAAVTLAAGLDAIAIRADLGSGLTATPPSSPRGALPRSWLDAMDRFEGPAFARRAMGDPLHARFAAVTRAERERLALEVIDAQWAL